MSRSIRFISKSRRRLTLFGVLVVMSMSAVAAIAYFTTTGHGTASAASGTVSAVTFSKATSTTPLYPGTSGDVSLTVQNPNAAAVRIPSLVLDGSQGAGGFAVDGGHASCGVSGLSFNAGNATAGWTVPANASAYAVDIANALTLSTSAANGCQGATFTVYLTVGP